MLGDTGSALRPAFWASMLSKTFNPLCCFCMVCLSTVPLAPNPLSSYPALCPRRLMLTDCIIQTPLPSGFRSGLNNGRHQEEPEVGYWFPAVFLSSIFSALSTVDWTKLLSWPVVLEQLTEEVTFDLGFKGRCCVNDHFLVPGWGLFHRGQGSCRSHCVVSGVARPQFRAWIIASCWWGGGHWWL